MGGLFFPMLMRRGWGYDTNPDIDAKINWSNGADHYYFLQFCRYVCLGLQYEEGPQQAF